LAEATDWRARLEGLRIPEHIAVVMDGNGRWARQRGLPRIQGHLMGRQATARCVEACNDIGVKALSVYAFSVENWRRPFEEVEGLMALIEGATREEIRQLHENNIRLIASGRLGELPASLQRALVEGREGTRRNTGMVLNILINYGGRAEIVDAARAMARRATQGDLDPETIDESTFREHLYAPELPDPDLLLRPGGEIRISNFLLWEIAYSEIIVMPVLWPDFTEDHLVEAIEEYNRRHRRFGGLEGDDDADRLGLTGD